MNETKRNKIIGKSAIGTRADRSYRKTYRSNFPRGWRTRGIISRYDPKKRKYLIEGTNFIFNETGEFQISGSGDWFSRSQIEMIEE